MCLWPTGSKCPKPDLGVPKTRSRSVLRGPNDAEARLETHAAKEPSGQTHTCGHAALGTSVNEWPAGVRTSRARYCSCDVQEGLFCIVSHIDVHLCSVMFRNQTCLDKGSTVQRR